MHIAASNTATGDVTNLHIEYLIQTYYIIVLILLSKPMKKINLNDSLNTI